MDFNSTNDVNCYFENIIQETHTNAAKYYGELTKHFFEKHRIASQSDNTFGHLLDVGCGAGIPTVYLAEYFDVVTAVDISEAQIVKAKKMVSRDKITFVVGDEQNLPVADNSVDVISCVISAHFFSNVKKFVTECKRVLKTPGFVGIWTYFPSDVKPVVSETDQDLRSGKQLLDECLCKWKTIANSTQHPQRHVLNQYEEIYDSIEMEGIEKSHNELHYDLNVSLEQLLKHSLSIPFYGTTKEENPWRVFAKHLKQLWGVEELKDDEVEICVTFTGTMIVLSNV